MESGGSCHPEAGGGIGCKGKVVLLSCKAGGGGVGSFSLIQGTVAPSSMTKNAAIKQWSSRSWW